MKKEGISRFKILPTAVDFNSQSTKHFSAFCLLIPCFIFQDIERCRLAAKHIVDSINESLPKLLSQVNLLLIKWQVIINLLLFRESKSDIHNKLSRRSKVYQEMSKYI